MKQILNYLLISFHAILISLVAQKLVSCFFYPTYISRLKYKIYKSSVRKN